MRGCDFEIQGGIAEPRGAGRGEIARTYLYFNREWGMVLTAEEQERFERWNREDPPDEWEIERNSRIKAIQTVGNHFVENHSGQAGDCTPRDQCCRVCGASQACGDACISQSSTCRKEEPGCACDAERVCQ